MPELDGPKLIVIETSTDGRGLFAEIYNQRKIQSAIGENANFVQDNLSRSKRGVLRGLHYQLPPSPQGKLVRVSRGRIHDVVVDVRRSSPEFGQWASYDLTEERIEQLWVPPGFAHGFLAMADGTEVVYKVTEFWDPDRERAIRWDDPALGIEWPLRGEQPLVSDRDASAPSLEDAEVFD